MRPRGERGGSAVEFALVAPLLLLFLSGIVDGGRAMWAHIALQSAAQEASTYAARFPGDTTGIEERAVTTVDWPSLTDADVTIWCPADAVDDIWVRVRHDLPIVTPIVGDWVGGSVRVEKTVAADILTSGTCT